MNTLKTTLENLQIPQYYLHYAHPTPHNTTVNKNKNGTNSYTRLKPTRPHFTHHHTPTLQQTLHPNSNHNTATIPMVHSHPPPKKLMDIGKKRKLAMKYTTQPKQTCKSPKDYRDYKQASEHN
jgi:hypothetical protein